MFKTDPLFRALAAAGLLSVCTSGFAYQFEVGGNLGTRDADHDDDTVFLLEGTLYLNDIAPQNGPLKEYAFLGKASYVHFDLDDYGEDDSTTVDGRYLFDPAKGYFAEALMTAGQTDVLYFGAGLYLNPTSTVSAGFTRVEVGTEEEFLIGGEYRGLFALGSAGHIAAEAGLTLGELQVIEAGAFYYPTTQIGVGLNFTDQDSDDYEDVSIWTLTGSYFLQTNLEIYGSYANEDYDQGDADVFRIGANVRM